MGRIIMSGIVPGLTKPVSGTPLSTYAEGSIIKINENGNPVEFYVAKHNYETELNGAGRTLVVRKDCYDKRAWDEGQSTKFADCAISTWLNEDYKNNFSASLITLISETTFYYTPNANSTAVTTLMRPIFLLSATEFGFGGSIDWINVEGTILEIANTLKIAYLAENAVGQWTRSPKTTQSGVVVFIASTGNVSGTTPGLIYGSRPAFTLPSTTKIDENGQVIE